MAEEFKFDDWCASRQLQDATVAWLRGNGIDTCVALEGLSAEFIPIGDGGVPNLGEKLKVLGGVKALSTPTGTIADPCLHGKSHVVVLCGLCPVLCACVLCVRQI
jgi:hypothetical protein